MPAIPALTLHTLSPPTPPPPQLHRTASSPGGIPNSPETFHRRRFSTADEIDIEKIIQTNTPNDLVLAINKSIEQNIRDYGETHPTTVQLHIQMGNVCFREGSLVDAATAYRRAVDACSDDTPSGDYLSTAYLNLGTVYWRSGQIPYAIHCLKQALQTHEMHVAQLGQSLDESPTAASVFHQLGICYSLSEDWTNALDSLEHARSIRSRTAGSTPGPLSVTLIR